MKSYSCLLVFVIFAFHYSFTQDITKVELRAAVDYLNEALVHPKRKVLVDITSKNLTYGHSSGTLESREQFVDALLNGPFRFLSINTSEEELLLYGDTAVARHIMTAKGSKGGEEVDVNIGIMLVFKKVDGRILLLARQAYKL
ncbi:MAG: nuclear transport factor 2 family protein [Bacteroidota bacterium]